MLLGLFWALRTQTGSVRQLVQTVQDHLGPLLISRSSGELAGIAILAGVAEEFLFRGVMQVALGRVLSDGLALTITSVAFGLAHFLNPTYALLAFLAGAYLGALFLLQGNLLVPMVAHALYDFIALTCLVRRYRARG
ncbi:MAG: amino terminal protease self-immunity [Geminicoccaceae bacterium]|jgi:membrane protease YdiL (CAAX protease family)|nr:amino terminal protease self-immunity [Geminicoccaceae bacterium]